MKLKQKASWFHNMSTKYIGMERIFHRVISAGVATHSDTQIDVVGNQKIHNLPIFIPTELRITV